MALTNLPPQAYTQETLKKAYSWLQSQPDEIRRLATSPDSLVSIYLRALRHGDTVVQTASSQTFKSELKNLADEMRQFEIPEQLAGDAATGGGVQNTVSQPGRLRQTVLPPQDLKSLIDGNTWAILHEIKNCLNLSCEDEALRMLVRLGFAKVKTILPTDS